MIERLLMLAGSVLSSFLVLGVIMLVVEAKYRVKKLVKGEG